MTVLAAVRLLAGLAVIVTTPGVLDVRPVRADEATGRGVDVLERAREAAAAETFTGVVRVVWHDGRRTRTAEVPVHSAGGVIRFGDEVVGTGARRLVRGPDGWLTLWGHDVISLGPSPAVKYVLSVAPGPDVADRSTEVVEIRLKGADRPRERLSVDRSTGLVLRRELLDARGRAYRSVEFVSISPAGASLAAPRPAADDGPDPAGKVESPYEAPRRLSSGYHLVGAYDSPGHVMHLFYSDGLHALSVFEERGRLSTASMPGGGQRMELAGHAVRAYTSSVGETVVWEGDGVVYTLVSDAPWADVAAAVGDLPHAERPGRLRLVAEAVVSLFRWR